MQAFSDERSLQDESAARISEPFIAFLPMLARITPALACRCGRRYSQAVSLRMAITTMVRSNYVKFNWPETAS